MKHIFLMMSMGLMLGCASVPNEAAICDGTAQLRTDHAAALVADGELRSKVTGARLIGAIDAGCG